MRQTSTFVFNLPVLLVGCASTVETKPPPPVPIPHASAQRPDEVGKLLVGKVVEVTIETDEQTYVNRGSTTAAVPIGRAFIPLTTNLGRGSKTVVQQFYRYAVQRKGQPELDYCQLMLETGPYQAEALAFYGKHGYLRCGAFGTYPEHPLSVFMSKSLAAVPAGTRAEA